METQDRRIMRTQQALGDALVALIFVKKYGDITIKDITEQADVAHATFYRHYKSKDELLAQRLQEFVGVIESFSQEQVLQASEGYLIFKHVEENSALYHILLNSEGTAQVRKRVQQILTTNYLKSCQPLQREGNKVVPAVIAANHIAVSLMGLIEWWLDEEMPYPAHYMAQLYNRLVIEATLNSLSLNDDL